MPRTTGLSIFALLLAGYTGALQAQASIPVAGHVMRADDAPELLFCTSPGLSVTIHADSTAGGSTRMASGTGTVVGENFGTHNDVDEIVYFLSDHGRFAIGADTSAVRAGTTIFVPQGIRHGFMSDGDTPLRFYWVISPGGLAERFREAGRLDLSQCG